MMQENEQEDMALSALLAVAADIDAEFPQDLLRKTYAIQRNHQFDRDENREESLQDLRKLVDAHLENVKATP